MQNANNVNYNWQNKLSLFLEKSWIKNTIITLIIFNAITLGLETNPFVMSSCGELLRILDISILTVFVIEIILRIIALGTKFFKDPWCIFDFIVIFISLLPNSGSFSVLRSLRVLRVLRIFTLIPSMKRVIGALLSAVPGLLSIGIVLLIIYYVFAVIATKLFGPAYPEWFGDIGNSFYTLFQVMTLESWSMGISRPVMTTFPYAWMFFVPFVLIATFTMLNLFIAVIVNAMQSYSDDENNRKKLGIESENTSIDREKDLSSEIRMIRNEIIELKQIISKSINKDPDR